MKRASTIVRSAAVAASVAALGLGSAVGAQAADDDVFYADTVGSYNGYDNNAAADFHAYGDKFEIYDFAPDGAGVWVAWVLDDGRRYDEIYYGGGVGSHTVNYNFSENLKVEYQVCLIDNGDIIESTCSGWVTGHS